MVPPGSEINPICAVRVLSYIQWIGMRRMGDAAECPNCRSPRAVQDAERGETCCASCGMVLAERHGVADAAGGSSAPARRGMRSTTMGPMPDGNRAGNAKLARYDRRTGCRLPSGLRGGNINRLHAMCDKTGLPQAVRSRAVAIYVTAATKRLTQGHHTDSIMAASIYLACRESGVPRTRRDLVRACNMRSSQLAKDIAYMMDAVGTAPEQYCTALLITRIANGSGAPASAARLAARLADSVDDTYTAGKNPMVVAAALLYVALDGSMGAAPLAAAAGVTHHSVLARAKEMRGMGVGGMVAG